MQDDASDDMLWLLLKYEEMVEIEPKMLIFWLILRFYFVYALFHPTSYTSRFCQVKYRTKIYISVVSFISIANMLVKLKVLKVLRIDSASMKLPLFGFFGPLLSQILFALAEILTRGSLQ